MALKLRPTFDKAATYSGFTHSPKIITFTLTPTGPNNGGGAQAAPRTLLRRYYDEMGSQRVVLQEGSIPYPRESTRRGSSEQ